MNLGPAGPTEEQQEWRSPPPGSTNGGSENTHQHVYLLKFTFNHQMNLFVEMKWVEGAFINNRERLCSLNPVWLSVSHVVCSNYSGFHLPIPSFVHLWRPEHLNKGIWLHYIRLFANITDKSLCLYTWLVIQPQSVQAEVCDKMRAAAVGLLLMMIGLWDGGDTEPLNFRNDVDVLKDMLMEVLVKQKILETQVNELKAELALGKQWMMLKWLVWGFTHHPGSSSTAFWTFSLQCDD